MRRILVCCLVLALSLPLLALKIRSYDQIAIEQRRVVSAYCRLDFRGARLTPEGWARIRNLSTFRENPDFNASLHRLAIPAHRNSYPSNESNVAYVVIGRYDDGAGYVPMPR